jgi:uncharacterized protein
MNPIMRGDTKSWGRTKQACFLLAGSLALVLAALGVVLPVLPTTPFVLVAVFFFARSSKRAHAWLLGNRLFGRQLQDYLAGRGVSVWVKVGVLLFQWVMIGLSIGLFVPYLWAKLLLALIALSVTAHVLLVKNRARGA